MAQSHSRPLHQLAGLTIPSNDTVTYPTVIRTSAKSREQPTVPGIKAESFGSQADGNSGNSRFVDRPTKRQKLTEEGSRHKFVSQKKWKFADGQPWLPSKLSSKAQNASKASSKTKQEPISPSRSPSPNVVPSVEAGNHDINQLSSRSKHDFRPTVRLTEASTRPQHQLSRSQQSPSSPRSFVRDPATLSTQAVLASMNDTPIDMDLIAQDATDIISEQAPTDLASNIMSLSAGKAKVSRSAKALSMEKDAARIAALIAEKRRENESSLFRERLLKRQLQYRNSRDVGTEPGRDAESQIVPPSGSVPVVPSNNQPMEHRAFSKAGKKALPLTSHTWSQPLASHTHRQLAETAAKSSISDQMPSSRYKTTKATTSPALDESGKSTLPMPSHLNSTRQSLQEADHETRINHQSVRKAAAGTNRHRLRTTNDSYPAPSQPLNGSGPFEAEDADIAAQLTAFSNQLVGRNLAFNTRVQPTGKAQQEYPTYRSRQTTSPVPIIQSQALQRASSTTSISSQRPVDIVASSVPSPASLASSHSPASMSIRQFPQMEMSQQSHQALPSYTLAPAHNRPASTGQMLESTAAYYALGRQTWAAPENHMDRFAQNPQPGLVHMQQLSGTPATMTTTMQQEMAQPPVLTSNVNMFSGNARSSSGNGMGVTPPKPRVNMFSNTRGTPFPMHEVIRQIEMT